MLHYTHLPVSLAILSFRASFSRARERISTQLNVNYDRIYIKINYCWYADQQLVKVLLSCSFLLVSYQQKTRKNEIRTEKKWIPRGNLAASSVR